MEKIWLHESELKRDFDEDLSVGSSFFVHLEVKNRIAELIFEIIYEATVENA